MSSVKAMLWVGYSRESPDRSDNDSSLGMGLRRSPNPVLTLWGLPGCWFLPWFQALGFQDYCRTGEGGDGNRAWYNPTNLTVFTDFQLFFLSESSPNCCSPLVNFQSSEKVHSDIFFFFCQCFHCFFGGGFQSSLLCYFLLSLQCCILINSF